MRILLIEPDAVMARLYVRCLIAEGYEVDWQQSAAAAVAALDKRLADIVILELQLPGHNGLEFLYEMRSYNDWLEIPVMVHSFVPPEKITKALAYKELNIAVCLYKPRTSLTDLKQAIAKTIVYEKARN